MSVHLKRKTSDWDLTEELFLQCAWRSGHTILLLYSIDCDFSAVANITGNPRYRPANQMVDHFSERDILPKPMFPESIQARHQANRAGTGSNALDPKPRLGKDPRETVLVEMIEMPRGLSPDRPTPGNS